MLQIKFDFTLSLKRQPLRSVSIRLPKLFQYTFAYRATKLVKDFPEHIVTGFDLHFQLLIRLDDQIELIGTTIVGSDIEVLPGQMVEDPYRRPEQRDRQSCDKYRQAFHNPNIF